VRPKSTATSTPTRAAKSSTPPSTASAAEAQRAKSCRCGPRFADPGLDSVRAEQGRVGLGGFDAPFAPGETRPGIADLNRAAPDALKYVPGAVVDGVGDERAKRRMRAVRGSAGAALVRAAPSLVTKAGAAAASAGVALRCPMTIE